jgi:hypothetical protein
MPSWNAVHSEHVLSAMGECDQLGQDEFLSRHGFQRAKSHVLWHKGRGYDSKAVLGVAHGYATGTVATPDEFAGTADEAAKRLTHLGFDIEPTGDPVEDEVAEPVSDESMRAQWAVAAREHLAEAAKQYGALVTFKELAEHVQATTGLRTRKLAHNWIGDVLNRVAVDSAARNEPLLSALCVNAAGSVGEGYAVTIKSVLGETPADGDDHAAQQRFECYKFFGATMPVGGGFPALSPKLTTARNRDAKARMLARPIPVCPNCQIAVPASGICDNCD